MKSKKNKLDVVKFSNELIGIFNEYATLCDNYFKDVNNQIDNLELYSYYSELKTKIIILAKEYGVLQNE